MYVSGTHIPMVIITNQHTHVVNVCVILGPALHAESTRRWVPGTHKPVHAQLGLVWIVNKMLLDKEP